MTTNPDVHARPGPALTARRRWAETADWRHAYHGLPVDPGELIVPLCAPGTPVAVVGPTPGRPAPECPGCDQAWRQADHIAPRRCHESSAVPGPRDGIPLPTTLPTTRPTTTPRGVRR